MRQGYIPPKQQHDGNRNRRTQRYSQTTKQQISQPGNKRSNVRFLSVLVVIVLVIIISVVISGVLQNAERGNVDVPYETNSQNIYLPQEMPASTTAKPTNTPSPTATPTATKQPYNTLSQGSRGDDVKQMQSKLIQLGFLNDTADGIFGKNTLNAVKTFQTQNNLATTGIADNETLLILFSGYAKKYSPPQYSAGMYKIGYDIEPGEYIILANNAISAYFCLSSDSNGNDIIANDNFEYNSIITAKYGEYLEISRARMMLLSDFNNYSTIPKNVSGAMYKVGTNLGAGEYKLISTSDFGGYYCIYESSRQDNIIANDNFENRTYVTVQKGQYLVLSRCKISE